MPAIEPLCHLIGVNSTKLSKEEFLIIEAELFIRICSELKGMFREYYSDYFRVMKFTLEMENNMLEINFVRLILNDILATEEYNILGISNYIGTHEDAVHEVMTGINQYPSAIFVQRVIELHRTVRREIYASIIKKIASQYLEVA